MKILGWAGVLLLAAAGTATAGPTTRFGLTMAASDQSAPGETELGPTIALGEIMGPLTLEVDYAYLSFMDTHTEHDGMQRLGVNLRAEVYRVSADRCRRFFACTRGSALFVEGGVAERYGQWHIDSLTTSPNDSERAREAHVGIGIELDNRLVPYRYGWQFGVRLAVTPHDPLMDASCRSTTCATPASSGGTTAASGGTDKAVLLEWTFLVGS
jgi:hypothetical protein